MLHAEMHIQKLVGIRDPMRHRMEGREFWLSLAAGAILEQKVYKDNNPRLWNWDAAAVINIQIINSVAFKSVTGLSPPIPAISFEEYTRAGLPLLSFYGSHHDETFRVYTSSSTTRIRSVGDMDRSHATVGVRMKPDHGPVICACCEHRLCNAVLVPCRHIFCSWCIRFSMTESHAVTCGFCSEPAPTVSVYAAATSIDDNTNDRTAIVEGRGPKGVTPVRKLKGLFDREYAHDLNGGLTMERMYKPEIGDLIPTIPPSGLMMAQVLLECEMGLRSEAEVKELATRLFDMFKTDGRDTDDPLKLFVAMGASVRRECEEWGEWNPLVEAEEKIGHGKGIPAPFRPDMSRLP
jgi:hypothetical protein